MEVVQSQLYIILNAPWSNSSLHLLPHASLQTWPLICLSSLWKNWKQSQCIFLQYSLTQQSLTFVKLKFQQPREPRLIESRGANKYTMYCRIRLCILSAFSF